MERRGEREVEIRNLSGDDSGLPVFPKSSCIPECCDITNKEVQQSIAGHILHDLQSSGMTCRAALEENCPPMP